MSEDKFESNSFICYNTLKEKNQKYYGMMKSKLAEISIHLHFNKNSLQEEKKDFTYFLESCLKCKRKIKYSY